MSFNAALKAVPICPGGASASKCRAMAMPRSPSILRMIVSAVGIAGGLAEAMGSSADPAESLVGGLILTIPLRASSASAELFWDLAGIPLNGHDTYINRLYRVLLTPVQVIEFDAVARGNPMHAIMGHSP